MKKPELTLTQTILLAVVALLAYPVWCCFSAKMESDAYNRITGAHTTWWDALWLELRVNEPPSQK